MAARKVTEAEVQEEVVQTYLVQTSLLHDGTPCIPGDTVPGAMFTDAQAAYLIACGTLKPLEPATVKVPPSAAGYEPAIVKLPPSAAG